MGTEKGRAEDRRRDQMSLVVETDNQKKKKKRVCLAPSGIKNKVSQAFDPREP